MSTIFASANDIKDQLDTITQSNTCSVLRKIFAEVLWWDNFSGSPMPLSIGAPVSCEVRLEPVAQAAGLPVFLVRWPNPTLPGVTARRAVQRALSQRYVEHLLCYLTSQADQLAFVWARRRPDGKVELRTLPYQVGAPARTTLEQLARLRLAEGESTSLAPIQLLDRLNDAFNVEAVTKKFFEDYKRVFADLQDRLTQATSDKVWAHDYALQLLNRLMFLYFIQRKGWLGNNPNFMADFWQAYKSSGQPENSFFDRWLSVLFFEAFNNKFHGGRRYFPEKIFSALAQAPFLNGGLFTENDLDTKHDPKLPDDFFSVLFDKFNGATPGFLQRYNFTIAESNPLDIEVAVDPEMIGKVYESLVNITFEGVTEEDLRGSAGIFYTPRVEIDLMCRLSLTDALANRLGQDKKPLLYDAIFAYDPPDKEAADHAIANENLWPNLNQVLRELTVCDPACGSGSFLVGMLLVLDDLQARANTQLGIEETPYERRRRIIGEQLYGVDIMDWAVHVAELRLWLQLVVETELKPAELHFRPLLPNLSFKIRHGDSLVQEIAGIDLGLHRSQLDVPNYLKGKITQLKSKKLRFYQGENGLREGDLKKEELDLFRQILAHKQQTLQEQIKNLTQQIQSPPQQGELDGIGSGKAKAEARKLEDQWKTERAEKQAELHRLEQALHALQRTQQVPFVWDIAFVEIFEADKRGFDIVIGNPPYVRQEMIAPPTLNPADFGGETSDRWKEQKKAYKAKLQQSVAAAWPKFFRYNPAKADFRKLDGKSDLYIYFYLHGLALLNPQGSFCFITSNSWLDVGYGADLQEFLLKHSHIKFILDNERKRSFAQADVNTIIALLGAPDERRESGLEKTARFVMFKVPFEEVLDAETFKTLEAATEHQSTDRWRISVLPQCQLFEEGLVREEGEEETQRKPKPSRGPLIKTARYEANKWGGKYLRAPEIFFTILEKGKGKLVRLGDIAEVRYGIKTGADGWFHVKVLRQEGNLALIRSGDGSEHLVEQQFLRPLLRSAKECPFYELRMEHIGHFLVVIDVPYDQLKGYKVSDYVRHGETCFYPSRIGGGIPATRPTCMARGREWYRLAIDRGMPITGFFFKLRRNIHVVPLNSINAVGDDALYEIRTSVNDLIPLLNSTLMMFFLELYGRTPGGGSGPLAVMVEEVKQLPVLTPLQFSAKEIEVLIAAFKSMKARAAQPVTDEIHQPDRRALDDVVFDVLGLTAGEREAVYEAVMELVRARLEKAKSL